MKYCPRCQGVYDDRMTKCPMCETTLETADEKMQEKLEKQIRNGIDSAELKTDKTDILLCVLLAAVTIAEIVFAVMGNAPVKTAVLMTAVNVLLILSLIFKKFFLSHFTWQSATAKKNGEDPSKISPPKFYLTMQKAGYFLWFAVCVYLAAKGYLLK